MSLRTGLVLTLAAAAAIAVGCGHRAPTGPVTNGGGDGAPGFLVWTTGENGAAVTRWLDGDGQVMGQADGRLLAHAGHLWRIQLDKRAITGDGCEEGDGGEVHAGSGSAVDLSLVPVDGGEPIDVVTGPGETGDAGELDAGADVAGQLGRYLVIEESSYVFACGVHGDGTVLSWVFDLSTGKRSPDLITLAELGHLTDKARAALADKEVEPDSELGLGEALPVWRDGQLAMSYLLFGDTCYACSDGDWSSYTAAVRLDDTKVPAALADEGSAVPPAVAGALTGLDSGGAVGVSWGRPDDAWRAAFAR